MATPPGRRVPKTTPAAAAPERNGIRRVAVPPPYQPFRRTALLRTTVPGGGGVRRASIVQRMEDDFFGAFGDFEDAPAEPAVTRTLEGEVSFADSRSAFTRIRKTGSEDMREIRVGVYKFLISSGHGYRNHATGIGTNAASYRISVDQVERAIIRDVIRHVEAKSAADLAKHYALTGITASKHFVLIGTVRVQYICNVTQLVSLDGDGKIRITDYIVLPAAGKSVESPFG